MKQIKKSVNLDLSNYVNIETGEILLSELTDNKSIKIVENTNLVILDSKDYFITDTKVMTDLLNNKIISLKDLGYIMIMSKTLKTEFNATYNYNIPHTLETLSELIDLSYDNTSRLIKKLCNKNVMHKYITAYETLYCINPFLTRKRKSLSKDLLSIFSKFKK